MTSTSRAVDSRMGGFTLLELVAALAIAAVLFAVLLPTGSRQRQHAELANAARGIADALKSTRTQAIMAGQPAAFTIDVQRALYRAAGKAAVQPLPHDTQVALYTARSEERGQTTGDIRFFPDGSSTGGAVTLGRSGERIDVLVDWMTGGVSVHEQPVSPPGR